MNEKMKFEYEMPSLSIYSAFGEFIHAEEKESGEGLSYKRGEETINPQSVNCLQTEGSATTDDLDL